MKKQYKIRWFTFLFFLILSPIGIGLIWSIGLESIVIAYLVMIIWINIALTHKSGFRKQFN